MVSFEEAGLMLDEIADAIPEVLYRQLNGGVNLVPQTKTHPVPGAPDLFVMGEYHHDAMGRYILLYYGSLSRAYGHFSNEAFREKLREVLVHELTHHNESLAGVKDLEVKDAMFLAEYIEDETE